MWRRQQLLAVIDRRDWHSADDVTSAAITRIDWQLRWTLSRDYHTADDWSTAETVDEDIFYHHRPQLQCKEERRKHTVSYYDDDDDERTTIVITQELIANYEYIEILRTSPVCHCK